MRQRFETRISMFFGLNFEQLRSNACLYY